MSIVFCLLSIGPMTHVEFKKQSCLPVKFKGQGSYTCKYTFLSIHFFGNILAMSHELQTPTCNYNFTIGTTYYQWRTTSKDSCTYWKVALSFLRPLSVLRRPSMVATATEIIWLHMTPGLVVASEACTTPRYSVRNDSFKK